MHVWRLSEDGSTPALFTNGDSFRFSADLVISGVGDGAAGLQISPYWSPDREGLFEVRTLDGIIGAYGGRLPSHGFIDTNPPNLRYIQENKIHLEMIYLPNGLSEASPATIEYRVTYNNVLYTSGPRAFDEGDPADDPPYGRWGILNEAQVGGYLFFDPTAGSGTYLRAEWSNIQFEVLTVAVSSTTWQQVKALYRSAK